MSASLNVGQSVPITITELDQNGHPLTSPVVPDSPPAWSQSTPATGTLAVAADGMSAQYTGVAAGTDTIAATLIAGGNSYSAQVNVTVAAVAQVLTSIELDVGTPTP